MAVDRVVYAGQPVAVVVGETEAVAEDGALAVEVDYEVRGATVDPLEGLKPDAPVVREHGGIDMAELGEHGARLRPTSSCSATSPTNIKRDGATAP